MLRRSKIALGLLGILLVFSAATFAGEAPRTLPPAPRQIGQEARTPQSQRERPGALKYADDEILVRFKRGASQRGMASAHASVGAAVMKRFRIVGNLEHVKLPRGISVKEAIKLYQDHPDVLYAEPNYIVSTMGIPNDPSFVDLWGLSNTGQSGGTAGADIDAPGAWDITTGSSSVVVAVIDTGVDYNHEDLAANIWSNADCNNNGIDDDGNGYVDDCHGIDVFNNDSDPMDDHDHGTHVSGTIGAVGNNALGVVGVNWNVKIMPCKFLSWYGGGYISGAIACLEYVKVMKDRGVNIIATNNSWGGGGFSQALYDAIDAHRERGILFIAAAGNAAMNNDSALFYPARFYLPNVIAVAATDRFDGLAYFSNFGRRTVHIGAPGHEILSTIPGNQYATFSGTSMATPHVTGLAALLKAQDPARDWRAIKNLILAGGDDIPSVTDTISQKRLNAQSALTCSNSTLSSRLRPIGDTVTAALGSPIDLAVLNIDCASANGTMTVAVSPGDQVITLVDDGAETDQAAGDGIYSGQFTPPGTGIFTLTFSTGDVITVQVLQNYVFAPVPLDYRNIGGTNLALFDDEVAQITSPFPILFGGGSFTDLWVTDNGTISFTDSFSSWDNTAIPNSGVSTLVAPFWDDLRALDGTNQNVWWEVTGTPPNRELVVEWRDLPNWNCFDTAVKFQVVFFEGSSDILFNYADTVFGEGCVAWDYMLPDNGASATVGVQVATDLANEFSFFSPSLNNNTALLWTLGSSQPPTPIISISPSSENFGNVAVGSSADKNFIVQNIGGGTLSGSASTSAPFSVVAGETYNLAPGESQTVTVRFSPSSIGTFIANVAFTGGGGASRTVAGAGVTQFTLTVAKSGTGTGAVTSNPAGVNCGGDCSENYNVNTVVTLTATPDAGSVFFGWFGDCSGMGTCIVTMDANKFVEALFNRFTLVVSKDGTGTGTVTSNPAGINCGGDCSEDYGVNTVVTLTAAPDAGSVFAGWGSFCSGTGTCVVTTNGNKLVTATFVLKRLNVTSPNGGEVWQRGTKRMIQWTSIGISGNVKIELSRNGGFTWKTLFSNTANDGSQSWKVTKPVSTQARIRVCSLSSPSICDTSDASFTIQ